jgi:Protein of unknown function (DUF4038)/Domain of unknown function (DUF5060)/Putative collagen-binding domain of a collagenase
MSYKTNHLYEFGPFRLDEQEQSLSRAGESVSLTLKAFDLLLMLVESHVRFAFPLWLVFFAVLPGGSVARPGQAEKRVAQWTRFEAQFNSAAEYQNPLQEVQVEVEFTSPGGMKHSVAAFWDGFKLWKARFSPEEIGRWTYRSRSSKESDAGLHNQTGSFNCVAYSEKNPLYRHGALRVSQDRHYLTSADGTPFFWLGDTAWNGPLKADAKSWDTYLKDRAAKGFNIIQYVTTQWRTATGNADGRGAWYGREKIEIDPVFFQWMDERLDAMNDHGLVGAPILIWTHTECTAQFNPGYLLPDDQIILLARYMVARWGAHHVVWMLAGDADYRGAKAERWKKIGRAVFGENHHRLATMHPGGRMWVQDEFANEPWFSFVGYQSGHSTSDESHRWNVEAPAQNWSKQPAFPLINLEPNYEAHIGRPAGKVFTEREVRRAAYWSLLAAPPAGVTYGGHGIWSWELKPNPPMTHPYTGIAQPWHVAVNLPGSVSMKHLKTFFSSFDWYKLRPAQELLVAHPGQDAPANLIVAAKSEEVVVIYIPTGGEVEIKSDQLKAPMIAEWFHPATGARTPAGKIANQGTRKFKASDEGDWVLLLKAK